ncbi:MAG: phosphoribosylformylglycinamidine synthase subunit PurS, partial [Candidatus Omnitrophica bacterium]|nr:phosphoribosylformylglycinamidine synthase subunit PurS [Candidatus Omnitrophota bacterium]
MIWRVEIKDKPGIFDAAGDSVHKDILDCGIHSIREVKVVEVYTINGDINRSGVEIIARDLLTDPIVQTYSIVSESDITPPSEKDIQVIEIAYNPGVMDPVEQSTLKGIKDLGIAKVAAVRTSKKYLFYGTLSSKDADFIVSKILSNKLIQHVVTDLPAEYKNLSLGTTEHRRVDLLQVDLIGAKDSELLKISREGQLYLNVNEMKVIQTYFKKLQRNPTDCELETIAQTWSEHCRHKTFRGNIRLKHIEDGKTKTQTIKNLLKSTIIKATQTLNKPWCVSVFHDNAGVIKFDKDYNVCFKVETHNHPSALEPFGGSNTGVGGVIRDTLGTGLAAKPICNTDVFCFAPPDVTFDKLPPGTLHPKRVMKGVISGVRDYGNKMGIPTVNGAIVFDRHFIGNPLVFCGNVGLIPKGKEIKSVRKGDLIVVMGGKTGRDGIHGAT